MITIPPRRLALPLLILVAIISSQLPAQELSPPFYDKESLRAQIYLYNGWLSECFDDPHRLDPEHDPYRVQRPSPYVDPFLLPIETLDVIFANDDRISLAPELVALRHSAVKDWLDLIAQGDISIHKHQSIKDGPRKDDPSQSQSSSVRKRAAIGLHIPDFSKLSSYNIELREQSGMYAAIHSHYGKLHREIETMKDSAHPSNEC